MGLQLEISSGRTLTIKGTKKVFRRIQRQAATTHSFTVQICLRCDGTLPEKLGKIKNQILKVLSMGIFCFLHILILLT